MSYFEEVDAWLTAVLVAGPEEGESEEQWLKRVKSQIKDKILESYRNGQKAGMKPQKKPASGAPEPSFLYSRKPRRQ